MENNNNILNELNEMDIQLPVSSMPKMKIPEGYFESFSSELLSRIKQDDFLEGLPRVMPFETPSGYFTDLGDKLSKVIQQQSSPDFIDSLPKLMPYEIPSNYFEELPSQIVSKLDLKSTQPLMTLSRKLIVKLSLAATILLFMGLAFKGLVLTSNTSSTNYIIENELAKVSDNEISQYIVSHQSEMDASLALETIDETKLDLKQFETEVLEDALNQITDEEILNYAL